MSKTALFSLIPLLLVIGIMIFLFVYKNSKTQATRRRQREPFIPAKNKNSSEIYFDRDYEDGLKSDSFYDEDSNYFDEKVRVVAKSRLPNQNEDTSWQEAPTPTSTAPMSQPESVKTTESTSSEKALPTNIIVLHLNANPMHPYTGYELLQALLTAGLRFGKMNIFHRHEEPNGRGAILFSLASAIEPGTFELNKMGAFTSPALVLFMRISVIKDPARVFEMMYSVAQQLIDDLGGEILDENRKPLTEEKVNQLRVRINSIAPIGQTADLFPNG